MELDAHKKTEYVVGRLASGVDYVIDSRARPNMISRVHARIRYAPGDDGSDGGDDGCWILCDNKSTNGVDVNQVRVSQHRLREGDIVVFGGHGLRPFGSTSAQPNSEFRYTFELLPHGSDDADTSGDRGTGGKSRKRKASDPIPEAELARVQSKLPRVDVGDVDSDVDMAASAGSDAGSGSGSLECGGGVDGDSNEGDVAMESAETIRLREEVMRMTRELAKANKEMREREEQQKREMELLKKEKEAEAAQFAAAKDRAEQELNALKPLEKNLKKAQQQEQEAREQAQALTRAIAEKERQIAEERQKLEAMLEQTKEHAEQEKHKLVSSLQEKLTTLEEKHKTQVAEDSEIEEAFTCSVCMEIFMDPVTTLCGHTFCKQCFYDVMLRRDTCPCCNTRVFDEPARAYTLHTPIEALLRKKSQAEQAERRERQTMYDREEKVDAKLYARLNSESQKAMATGRTFLKIGDKWGLAERHTFCAGISKYKQRARARALYCDIVGLTDAFIRSAPVLEIRHALLNVGIEVAELPGMESNRAEDVAELRNQLKLFRCFGTLKYMSALH